MRSCGSGYLFSRPERRVDTVKCSVELRALAILQRIAKALEDSNELIRYRNEREFPPINATDPPLRKKAVLSHPIRSRSEF